MAGNTSMDVMAQRVLSIAMIINGAPLVRDEKEQENVEHHRGNTAWHISFPSQGITFMVTDASGRDLLFTHDAAGRIISITDPVGRIWSYT